MIEAGQVLCRRCGTVFSGAYYHNAHNDVHLVLKHRGNQYAVEQFFPKGATADSNEYIFSIAPSTNLSNTHMTTIDVYVQAADAPDDKPEVWEFKRCCPFCYQKNDSLTDIDANNGFVPTYVIAVIGTKSVGKSRWIHALGVSENLTNLRTRYSLLPSLMTGNKQVNVSSTEMDDEGETNLLSIIDRKQAGSPFANVLILDFAGELFLKENEESLLGSSTYTLFTGTNSFSGVDGVIFFDSAEPEHQDSTLLTEAYNTAKGLGLLDNKPVAYVLSKLDLLLEQSPTIQAAPNPDRTTNKVPLLSKKTFPGNASNDLPDNITDTYPTVFPGMPLFTKEALTQRFSLQRMITASRRPLANVMFSTNDQASGFVIQSGLPNGADIDYRYSVNVLDPLVWMLNQLDIFPIDD